MIPLIEAEHGPQPGAARNSGTRLALLVLIIATVIALTWAVLVRHGAPLPIDLTLRDAITRTGPNRWLRQFAGAVTQLGSGALLYPILLVECLICAIRHRDPRQFAPILFLAVGQVLELAAFTTLHRPHPGTWPGRLLAGSFSSGRSFAAVLGWGLAFWLLVRTVRVPGSRPVLWTVALTAGVLVGATRVYLGLHWLTDALVGVALGSTALAGSLVLLTRLQLSPARPEPARSEELPQGVRFPGLLGWARTSPWAWMLPLSAAGAGVAPILLAPPASRLKDLLVYQGAGGIAGIGENVYDFRTSFAMPFTYPPFAALVVEPLSRMPLGLAQLVWTGCTLAATVALAAFGLRPVTTRIGLPLTVTALLVSGPMRSHLRFGQVGVFLVLLVALDLLDQKPHTGPARGGSRFWPPQRGWGLGLATAIKLTPAVFLPWLLITRRWRRLAGTLLWAGTATALGLLLLWPSSQDYLSRASRDTTRFGANDIPGNQSVRGMLLRVLPEDLAERAWLLAAVLLVAVGCYNAWRCERHGNRLAAVGTLAALSVAVSPISWVHHLIWLALPLSALVAMGRTRLAAGWFGILVISFPTLGRIIMGDDVASRVIGNLVIDLPGLSAVGAVLLLAWISTGHVAGTGEEEVTKRGV